MPISSSAAATSVYLCGLCVVLSSAIFVPRTKDFRSGSDEVVSAKNGVSEPTCEELKQMWLFSKRQSRAAEITNEIPMDPFSKNVWEPYYATSRSMGGLRLGKDRGPIYGTVVLGIPDAMTKLARNKAFEEVVRHYGTMRQQKTEPRRRLTTFRVSGGSHLQALGLPPQAGSFQHLKKLIKTQRARELQEQRLAEEAAAQNAAHNELLRNGNYRSNGGVSNYHDMSYNYDLDDGMLDDHGDGVGGREGILAFPDLLAPPAVRPEHSPAGYVQDYSYGRSRQRPPYNPLFDTTSSFNSDYNGYML